MAVCWLPVGYLWLPCNKSYNRNVLLSLVTPSLFSRLYLVILSFLIRSLASHIRKRNVRVANEKREKSGFESTQSTHFTKNSFVFLFLRYFIKFLLHAKNMYFYFNHKFASEIKVYLYVLRQIKILS